MVIHSMSFHPATKPLETLESVKIRRICKKEVDFIQSRFRPEKKLLINFLVKGQMPDNYRNKVGKIYYSFVDLGKSSIESTQENE